MNKSILITGCSSGIGLCAATTLKEKGYRVFATARKENDVEKLKNQGLESIQLDVTDPASINQALDTILKATGGTLDAIFNNAGYMQMGAIEDIDSKTEREQFETNYFGVAELTRRIIPIMRQQGHGRIVQNSSVLGVITLPFYGAYTASKFALEAFSHTLRQELKGTNIHVSIINPGPIQTRIREHAAEHFQQTHQSEPYKKSYENLQETLFNVKHRSKMSKPPEAVVKQLIDALESPNPRIHYYIGGPAILLLVFLKRILPDKTFDWLLTKVR